LSSEGPVCGDLLVCIRINVLQGRVDVAAADLGIVDRRRRVGALLQRVLEKLGVLIALGLQLDFLAFERLQISELALAFVAVERARRVLAVHLQQRVLLVCGLPARIKGVGSRLFGKIFAARVKGLVRICFYLRQQRGVCTVDLLFVRLHGLRGGLVLVEGRLLVVNQVVGVDRVELAVERDGLVGPRLRFSL